MKYKGLDLEYKALNIIQNSINLDKDKANSAIDISKRDSGYIEDANRQIKQYSVLSKNISKELENKKKLIASRERMLQISQEKNIYKEKIIYSYIYLVSTILVLLIVSYYYFKLF